MNIVLKVKKKGATQPKFSLRVKEREGSGGAGKKYGLWKTLGPNGTALTLIHKDTKTLR